MSRLRVMLFGFLYLAAMLVCGTLLATLIVQAQARPAPAPTATIAPAGDALRPLASATLPPTARRPTVTLRPTSTLVPTLTPDDESATCGPIRDGYRWHYVQWGETLFGLAQQYGVSMRAIKYANNLGWSNHIAAGACLRIPQ